MVTDLVALVLFGLEEGSSVGDERPALGGDALSEGTAADDVTIVIKVKGDDSVDPVMLSIRALDVEKSVLPIPDHLCLKRAHRKIASKNKCDYGLLLWRRTVSGRFQTSLLTENFSQETRLGPQVDVVGFKRPMLGPTSLALRVMM